MPTSPPTIGTEPLVSTLARKFAIDIQLPALAVSAASTASSATLTSSSAHGLSVGDQVTFTAAQAPLATSTAYYVVSVPSATTLTVSATSGGAAIVLTAAGSNVGSRAAAWTRARGVINLKPKIDSNFEDDSDFDSAGWGSQTKTAMSWSLEISFKRAKGLTSLAYDPVQEYLRTQAFAFPGAVTVRWYDRDLGPEAYSGVGSPSWEPDGGDYKGLDTAKCTIMGQGIRNAIANPLI